MIIFSIFWTWKLTSLGISIYWNWRIRTGYFKHQKGRPVNFKDK